ncbi:hypothetical protein N7G274_005046 [Stereocaulon virgatum]|uniref:Amidoligase enzyme n=1 Tax=Stereocaulon virgatum TaxID=373712 RepID=A0ABR4A9I9_9LECA
MDNSLSLTFGIELECLIEYDPAGYDSDSALRSLDGILGTREHKIEMLVCRGIACALSSHGFPATDWMQNPSPQTWVVDRDRSIQLPANKPGRSYLDIELKSPAYNLLRKALDQVQSVVSVVTEEFTVHTNDSCGLHVHVGNQRKGFPLQTFKNFCMLTTVFEPQFNSLHPPERLGDSFYLRPLTRAFEGVSPLDTALLIQSCRTHEQLVKRFTGDVPDRYYAYNFCPLVFKPIFGTIEFRQHKATLDTDAIGMWIELACGMVRTAHNIPFDKLAHLIEHAASGMYMDAIALLSELELHDNAEYYGRQRRYSHPRPAWAWVNPMVEEAVELTTEGTKDKFVNGEMIIKTVAKNALE